MYLYSASYLRQVGFEALNSVVEYTSVRTLLLKYQLVYKNCHVQNATNELKGICHTLVPSLTLQAVVDCCRLLWVHSKRISVYWHTYWSCLFFLRANRFFKLQTTCQDRCHKINQSKMVAFKIVKQIVTYINLVL